VLLALIPAALAAQVREACPQGRIGEVFIDNVGVFDLSDPALDGRFAWAYRLANRLHATTRPAVIERDLLFGSGECLDAELVAESERVLRSRPYLAAAEVTPVRQPDGSHQVVVRTQDEWSTRVEVRLESRSGMPQLTGLALREDNLAGSGRHLSLFYLPLRDGRTYGARFETPQLLGSRWQGALAGGRTPSGYLAEQVLALPFLGERGGRAVRQRYLHADRSFEFIGPGAEGATEILLPERRRSFDVGGAFRFGQPGTLRMLGLLVTGEWVERLEPPRYAREELRPPHADLLLEELSMQRDSVASVRLMVVGGQRNLTFVQRRGLETLRAVEDVRLGVEVELGVGRSLPWLAQDDDLAMELGLFAAGPLGEVSVVGVWMVMEGKRDFSAAADEEEWQDIFTQLDAWLYWRPNGQDRHTVVGALRGSGGWHTGVPFQLTLGSATGLRGHPWHLAAGGQRLVGSAELRSRLDWPFPRLFDLGTVLFLDGGRVWAGDVPFGEETRMHVSAGAGLRLAFPSGSRQTFRLDVGVPLAGEHRLRPGFTVGIGQAVGLGALRTDPQLQRSSRSTVGRSLFTYPE